MALGSSQVFAGKRDQHHVAVVWAACPDRRVGHGSSTAITSTSTRYP